MKKTILALALLALTAGALSAFDTTALQIAIWAPKVQLVPPEIAVGFLKLNLPYGSNYQVTGIDLGLVSINNSQGDEMPAEVTGFQLNLWNSTDGVFAGGQIGLVNIADNSYGLEIGLVNVAATTSSGCAIGLVNTSHEFNGLAVGLVNYTEFLRGIQIGIVNVATRSTLPFFPIINMCF